VPLIAIDTLRVMTVMAMENVVEKAEANLFCPMIDARRMEVYAAIFNSNFETVKPVSAEIIDSDAYASELSNSRMYFFGNGVEKCKTVISSLNAIFIDEIVPLAENMIQLAENKFKNSDFEDIAYYQPFYLKEFQATTPKSKS
jgi:tRNA threonylcarbamoyladenosine biosynthesis protein TsaB